MSVGAAVIEQRPALSEARARIRHIRLPEDPNIAWCGARKDPAAKRRYWHEVSEADICVVCLSFPGAREYGMGA